MGIATHLRDGFSATELISAADVALYDAKDLGGNRFASGSDVRGAAAESGGRLGHGLPRGRAPRPIGEPIGIAPVRSGEG